MTFSIALVPRGLGSFLLFFPPFSCFISSCVAVLSTRRGASAIEGVFVQAVRGILELADGASRSSIVYTFLVRSHKPHVRVISHLTRPFCS